MTRKSSYQFASPDAEQRSKDVAESRKNPKIAECGHRLAADQVGVKLCSPCQTKRKTSEIPDNEFVISPYDATTPKMGRGREPGVYLDNLKSIMQSHEVTPRQLCTMVGLKNPSNVRKHANLAGPAAMKTARRYAEVLNVTVEELIGKGS